MPSIVTEEVHFDMYEALSGHQRGREYKSHPSRGVGRNESQTQNVDMVTQHKSTATTSKIMRW